MKNIYFLILAMMAAVIGSCHDEADEPHMITSDDGRTPLALRAVTPEQSRAAIPLYSTHDIYCCAVLYYPGGIEEYEDLVYGYYGGSSFKEMKYDADSSMFYIEDQYYPMVGNMDLLSYGVEKGSTPSRSKSCKATGYPSELDIDKTAEYLKLTLTDTYDGSFDVIAADRMKVKCGPSLKSATLPFGHYHHILSHITVKLKWADGVTASDPIVSKLKINSVKIKNTPCQGSFYIEDKVASGHWEMADNDVVMPKTSLSLSLSVGTTYQIGESYIVPQSSRKEFILKYTIQNGSSSSDYRTLNYVVQDDPHESWLPGYKYTYVLTIGNSGDVHISDVGVELFKEGNTGTTEVK